ncbi:DUF2029 domain-containing protein [Hymenobacter terrenus]|uniref:DUF2029 domain-containing protein n=1 Tax=Hymenobacter terrenus TaxID=1629124 RepID=UPI000619E1B2|nr:DUF2029 domain-containing protein [Hymenobacter terrenus]
MVKQASVAIHAPVRDDAFRISRKTLLILTAFTAGCYFVFSFASTGFYQQDEVGHFLGMLTFWDDPRSILSNWAKFGYKLLYAVPALAGINAVTLLNCLLAAGSGYLAARAVEARGSRMALAAFVLTVAQPLWVALAFRNYSEIPTAFLLVLAYYLHVRRRPLLSMLCISYICTIRQEFFPFLGLYGLDLLRRREWAAAGSSILFPLLQNFYGAYFYGDPIYLLHQIMGQSGNTQDLYPRQGFGHYFLTSMVIFGPAAVTLLVHYLGWSTLKRQRPDWYLVVPIVGYLLLHCFFNWKGAAVGPSTGGNLRYLLVVSPLVAVAGAYGLAATLGHKERFKAAYWLGPLLVGTFLYLNYKNNGVKLTTDPDDKPGLGVLMACTALLLPGTARLLNYSVAGVAAFVALLNVRPIKLSEEDRAMQDLAYWFRRNEEQYAGRPIYVNHTMFFYWLKRSRSQFTPAARYIDQPNVDAAPKGSLFLWDSHYSYRLKHNPKAINYDYFLQSPTLYSLQEQFVTPSQSFAIVVFEKK